MAKYFITATGTEIGKTYLCCQMLKQLKNSIGLKPIISGYDKYEDNDLKLLSKACGVDEDKISLYKFNKPIAPALAANEEGVVMSVEKIARFIEDSEPGYDNVIVEGAGGAFVPISEDSTFNDLIKKLDGYKVILVAGNYLGTISHTVATYRAMLAENVTVSAIILNEQDQKATDALESNRNSIEQFTNCKTIAIKYGETIDVKNIA